MNLRWLWFDHIPSELTVPREARPAIAHVSRKVEHRQFAMLEGPPDQALEA